MDPLVKSLLEILRRDNFRGTLTLADASAKSGQSLEQSQRALFGLMSLYPSRLDVTDTGALVFDFPEGVAKKRKEQGFWGGLWGKTKSFFKGASRFLLRGWITVAIVGYALLFVALFIALAVAASQSDSDEGFSVGGDAIAVLMRVVLEAMYWWWHPFSPVYRRAPRPSGRRSRKSAKKDDVPFYEKVNRFVFGPEEVVAPENEHERKMVALIRAQKGVIGVADVMRVSGVKRAEADALLAKLMLDYEGEVRVSEEGGIAYVFEQLRLSTSESRHREPNAVWKTLKSLPKLTGNAAGANMAVLGLNALNFFGSIFALANNLTIQKIVETFQTGILVSGGSTAWLLGVIPLFFSTWIFAMPIWRLLKRRWDKKDVEKENGRLGLMKKIFDKLKTQSPEFSQSELENAFATAAERKPTKAEIREILLEMGGDLDANKGQASWRFVDLEAEAQALAAARGEQMAVPLGESVYDVSSSVN